MGNTDYYKIGGTARNVNVRVQELQTGNPLQFDLIYSQNVNNCRVAERNTQNAAEAAAGTQRITLRSHTSNRNYQTEWFRVNNLNAFGTAVINALGK